jgi:hypothetical protein
LEDKEANRWLNIASSFSCVWLQTTLPEPRPADLLAADGYLVATQDGG